MKVNLKDTKHSGAKRRCFRRMMALTLAGVMLFGSAFSVQAATLKDVFDTEYYSDSYDDLKSAFGTNKTALYRHYTIFGKNEGRSATELIDVQKYRAAYPDLDAAFGDDWDAYVNHYITYGFNEGRNSFGSFDARAYADRYPDLKAAFGYDVLALYKHYMNFGRAEGRNAAPVVYVPQSNSNDYSGNQSTGGSDDGSSATNTAPITALGCLVDPETGAPVANATVTFTLTSFNPLAEIVTELGEETTEDTEAAEVTEETTEDTEAAEVTEETTEDTEAAEVAEETTEDTEAVEVTEETTEDTEAAEVTEETTEDTEAAEVTEETTEDTEDTEETEETEESDVTVGDGYYVVTTDENGYYAIPDFAPGVYSVVAEAPGYMSLTLNSITINSDAGNFTLPTFQLLSSNMGGANVVAGDALDATTGAGIANVTLNIRANWNNTTGDVISTVSTDDAGHYSVELQRGYYTIEFVIDGYTSTFVNVASSNNVGPTSGVLSPTSTAEVSSTEFRIVLTWGETPRDLDSHLVGPDDENGYFHVCFYDKVYVEDGEVVASLDVDDVTSYGPETVTLVNARTDKTYYYSVRDFTNGGDAASTEMSASGANVKVYQGSVLVAEYNVPLNQAGFIWNVFKIENGSVVGINNYNSDEYTIYGDYLSAAE